MTSNVSALFINYLLAAIALSVFHKTKVSLVLVQYAYNKSHVSLHNNKQYSGSEISWALIEARMCPQCWEWISFRYPLQILQMVAGEAILSCPNAIKPLVSAPYPARGSGCGPWCLSPPVGECCPLVGVPPSATTGCCSTAGFSFYRYSTTATHCCFVC